jgi:aminoglycoside phosphotransferase
VPTASDHLSALKDAAASVSIDSAGAKPIRIGNNALYRLPGNIVARVSRPGHESTAAKEVAVARWLEQHDVPAVTALDGIPQPVQVGNRAVTFWRELPAHQSGTLRDVAALLRKLHQLPPPTSFELPTLEPFAGISERIRTLPGVTDEQRSWLAGHLADLKRSYATDVAPKDFRVIHGDAHTGNVVTTDQGKTLFLDFERVAIGPPAWDLVSIAVLHDSVAWINGEQYADFVRRYGEDVIRWRHYEDFRDIRELRMTCYVAQLTGDHTSAKREALLRIDCLRGRHGTRPWPWSPM